MVLPFLFYVIFLTLEVSIAGKCFFLGSFLCRFSCGILTVLAGGRADQRSDSGSEDLQGGSSKLAGEC